MSRYGRKKMCVINLLADISTDLHVSLDVPNEVN